VDNIKMDVNEIRYDYIDWTHVAQDTDYWRALITTVMNLGVPLTKANFLSS
jgi:hypothetical protein